MRDRLVAELSRTSPAPSGSPSSVSRHGRIGAALGAAGDMQVEAESGGIAAAISAAMARAGMWPEAQAGEPGQAAIRARGSAGSTTKPAFRAASRTLGGGVGRADQQQRALRREADFCGAERFGGRDELDQRLGAAWPKGRAIGRAKRGR